MHPPARLRLVTGDGRPVEPIGHVLIPAELLGLPGQAAYAFALLELEARAGRRTIPSTVALTALDELIEAGAVAIDDDGAFRLPMSAEEAHR